jgi:hypothetical protein
MYDPNELFNIIAILIVITCLVYYKFYCISSNLIFLVIATFHLIFVGKILDYFTWHWSAAIFQCLVFLIVKEFANIIFKLKEG